MRHLFTSTSFCIAAALITLGTSAGSADARQCIWNKSGANLGVYWYRPADIKRTEDGKLYVRSHAKVIQFDWFPTAQGKCQRTNQKLVAFLECSGCNAIKKPIQITVGVLAGAAAAAACMGTAGAGCPAAAAAAVAVTAATEAVPDPKKMLHLSSDHFSSEVFAMTIPPNDRWLDVWGSAWKMKISPGGKRWFQNNDRHTCNPCADK